MQKIEFDEGYRTYQIGDSDRIIKIRLDPDLMTRIKAAESRISDMEDRLKNAAPDELTALSDEIKDIFNSAFGTDVCTPAFDGASVFTLTGGGKMLFQSFFEAFIPVLTKDIEAIGKAQSEPRPEVQKYMKKEMPALDISKLPPEKLALLEQLLS